MHVAPALCLGTKKIVLQMEISEPPSVGKNSLGRGLCSVVLCESQNYVLMTVCS